MVIDVKRVFRNACVPMLASCEFAANISEFKVNICSNARSPILVTDAGIVIDCKLVAPMAAYASTLVTVFGMIYEV